MAAFTFWFLLVLNLIREKSSFIKKQTSDTSSDNEWQRVTKMTTSGTTSYHEWYSKWQQVVISANSPFYPTREKPTTKHPKDNSLDLEEDLEEGLFN